MVQGATFIANQAVTSSKGLEVTQVLDNSALNERLEVNKLTHFGRIRDGRGAGHGKKKTF